MTHLPKTRRWVWRKARPVIQEKASQNAATTLHSLVNLQPPMRIQMLPSMRYNIFSEYFRNLNRRLKHLKTVHFLNPTSCFAGRLGLVKKTSPWKLSKYQPKYHWRVWTGESQLDFSISKCLKFKPYTFLNNCYQALVITKCTFSKNLSMYTHRQHKQP